MTPIIAYYFLILFFLFWITVKFVALDYSDLVLKKENLRRANSCDTGLAIVTQRWPLKIKDA